MNNIYGNNNKNNYKIKKQLNENNNLIQKEEKRREIEMDLGEEIHNSQRLEIIEDEDQDEDEINKEEEEEEDDESEDYEDENEDENEDEDENEKDEDKKESIIIVEKIKKDKKKKKIRFFDSYINKALKQVSNNEITNNAKQQLNHILISIAKLIGEKSLQLAEISKKKTISIREIENAIHLLFIGDLEKVLIEEGNKSIKTFKNNENEKDKKGTSRQNRAGILFPASICEKFLRRFGYVNVMISNEAPIFLASCLEYLAAEILDLASSISTSNNHVRITVRDFELAIRSDYELNNFFNTWKITFLGGGIIPFINPAIIDKKKGKRKNDKQLLLKEINNLQKQGDCLIFAKYPFEQIIRTLCENYKKDIKISKQVFIVIQYYIEQQFINLIQKANNLAIYSGRIKLIPSDIEMVLSIEENRLPNFLDKDIEESESESTTPLDSPTGDKSEDKSDDKSDDKKD